MENKNQTSYTCWSEEENHALYLIAEKFGWRGDLSWEEHRFMGNQTMVFGRYDDKVFTHMRSQGNSTLLELLLFITELEKTFEVELNSEYIATVKGDKVFVGCQSFPVSKIKELYEKITSNEDNENK